MTLSPLLLYLYLLLNPFQRTLKRKKKKKKSRILKSKIVFFDALLTRRQVSPALVCQKKRSLKAIRMKKKYCNISLIKIMKNSNIMGVLVTTITIMVGLGPSHHRISASHGPSSLSAEQHSFTSGRVITTKTITMAPSCTVVLAIGNPLIDIKFIRRQDLNFLDIVIDS